MVALLETLSSGESAADEIDSIDCSGRLEGKPAIDSEVVKAPEVCISLRVCDESSSCSSREQLIDLVGLEDLPATGSSIIGEV